MNASPHPSVAHVLWSGHVGGIERLVHDLAAEQSRLGMEVAVAFGQAGGFFAERIRDLGVQVLDLDVRSGYDLWPRRLARRAEALRDTEVLHAHGFNLPLSAIMRRSGRPIVFTEHGQFGLGRRLGLTGWTKQEAQRRFVTRHCAELAANSHWTADRMAKTYGIGPDRITIAYNGIEPLAAPVEDPPARDGGPIVVVFAGQLKPFKRVDRLIRAVACVRDRGSVRVLIAGGGPLEHDLMALARELGVDSRTDFLGWRPDIAEVLRQADVLVLPSEGEPFGLALVEGCAQGLLPIAFADGGGALECMPPDGRVVRDEDELAAVLHELRASEALAPAARAARASWAIERFPIAKTATRYLELYRSAATGNLGSAR